MIPQAAACVIFAGNCINDIRRKEIFLFPTVIAGALGLSYSIYNGGTVLSILLSLLPGVLFFAFCALTHGQIGGGDALAVTAAGLWLGFFQILCIVWIACMIATVVSVFLIIRKKQKTTLPFLPFLMAAWAAERIMVIL